jgi:hypothetical protein
MRETTAANGDPAQTPHRFGDQHRRNEGLDYLRAAALLMMSLIHMLRDILGNSGADAAVRFFGECAPLLFFSAFGMTQNRMVKKDASEIMRFVLLFGLIGVFHGHFLGNKVTWDFFLFLWSSALLVLWGHRLGLDHRLFLVLSVAILAVNFVQPLGFFSVFGTQADPASATLARYLWRLPGPFFPLPWAVLVFFGFALGMEYRARAPQLYMAAVAVAVLAALDVTVSVWPDLPLAARLGLDKWAATSPYCVFGCAGTLLVYATASSLCHVEWAERWVYPTVRLLSDNLMVATVAHYLVLRALTVEPLQWCRAVNGVRTVSWGVVCLLSVANVVLVVVALKLALRLWDVAQQRLAAMLRRMHVGTVTVAGLVVWAGLYLGVGSVRPGYLRSTAYAAMLSLALFYGYDRDRRRAAAVRREEIADDDGRRSNTGGEATVRTPFA